MNASLHMLALGWVVVSATACAHRTVPKLLNNRLSPDLPYCEELPKPGPSQLDGLVEELAIPEDHTGVLLLERGASALIARAWLVENAVDRLCRGRMGVGPRRGFEGRSAGGYGGDAATARWPACDCC